MHFGHAILRFVNTGLDTGVRRGVDVIEGVVVSTDVETGCPGVSNGIIKCLGGFEDIDVDIGVGTGVDRDTGVIVVMGVAGFVGVVGGGVFDMIFELMI